MGAELGKSKYAFFTKHKINFQVNFQLNKLNIKHSLWGQGNVTESLVWGGWGRKLYVCSHLLIGITKFF